MSHVVEVVAQRDDVSTHPLCQVVDALAPKHTAVGTRHSGRIFVLFNNRWKALHHLVHFEKRQFRVGDNVVLHAQAFAQRSGAFDRGGSVAFNPLVHRSRNDGDVPALTDEINDCIEQDSGVFST